MKPISYKKPSTKYLLFRFSRRFHRSRFYPNKRNAKKFIIGALIFIAVQIGLFIIIKPFSARAAWYDANYGYRQSITITNNGSQQTNYVVEITVDTKTLQNAGKLQTDCDDIRFTSSDGSTHIDHFIDYCSTTANVNSSLFVEVPTITAATTTTIYMYYGYASATADCTPADCYTNIGATTPAGIWLGTGKDGAISVTADTNINTADTISGRACTDAGITYDGDAPIYTSTDNVAANDTDITLATTPDSSCLVAGDEVLIFNARGTDSSTGDGKYEFNRISSISTNTLTFTHKITNAYNGGNRKLIVQRVPNYTTVTLSNSNTDFTPSAWDGTTNLSGGVMAFRASGTVTVAANTTINANGLGYAGGTAGTLTEVGGNAGESYDGASTGRGGNGSSNGQTRGGGDSGDGNTTSPGDGGTTTGAGGGGGSDGSGNNTDGSAGAGGGGGYAGGGGGGAGGTDGTTTTGRNGGTGGAAGTQAGGGGGGCADSNTNTVGAGGNAGSNGGTSTGCGSGNGAGGAAGTSGNQASGGGGSTSAGSGGGGGGGGYYGTAALTTLYFGSGGGGGGARDDGADGGNGGAGGGIVYVNASTISVSGSITSTGANGSTASTGGGNGGGGAGGSILLRTITDTGTWTAIVTALGGNGGGASTDRPDGGDGGNGRMHFDYTDSGAPGSGSPTADTSQVPYSDSPTSELSYADYQASFNISTTWKFDEGYGTTAYDSINTTYANNGTLAGTTTPAWKTSEFCVFGNCLYFEGTTAKVTLANDQNVKSVSMWVRPTSFASTMGLVDFGNSVRMTVDTSGVMTATGFTSATKYINGMACSTCTLTLNKWQHIEVVDTSNISATSMVLGNYSTNYFKGFMDEVRMTSVADTALQVKNNYSARGSPEGVSAMIGNDNNYLSDGLVGYWKMDDAGVDAEGETSTDASGNSNNATLYGDNGAGDNGSGMTCTVAGKFGTGCQFDGTDDYINAGSGTSLDNIPQGAITVSVWVKCNYAGGNCQAIAGKDDGGTNGWSMKVSGNEFSMIIPTSGTAAYSTVNINSLSTDWHHLTATYNNLTDRKIYLYINGREGTYSTQTAATNTVNTDASLTQYIGWRGWVGSEFFNGSIDDFRIYNRALSPTEVSQLYSWAPGPISYWKLDEASLGTPNCSTSVVSDSSGNGHSGTACPNSTGPKGGDIGKFGRSVNFDGSDDYINITDDAVFDIDVTKDYTWSMWIKPTSLVEGNWQTIWSQTITSSEPNFLIYAMNIDGSGAGEPLWGPVTNGISVGWDHGSNQLMTHTNNNVLSTGIWSYVTVTYDHTQSQSSRLKIYINGVDQTDTSDIYSAGTIGNIATTHTRIGNSEKYGEYFPGRIDDVKIYNYRRSAKQIISDMNADHPIVGTPVAGPVGHWKFDEGALNTCTGGDDFCDTTPNTNDLTYSTTTGGITQSGKFGKAYDGANNTRATRNDDSDFDFSNGADDFTISAWFNRGGAISNAEYLVDKHSTNDGYTLYMDSDGDIVCGIGDGAASFPEETIGGSLSKNYDDTSWHHAVCVKEGTTALRLYVDGIEIASDTSLAVTDDMSNSGKLIIADANETDGTDEWLGDIDEVKIYRAALNAQDVKLEYNQGKSIVLGALSTDASGNADNSASRAYCPPGNIEGNCASGQNPAPFGEWKFEEHTGTTANDTSTSGLSGTLTNGPAWVSGKIGSALSFDGVDDYINITDNAVFDIDVTKDYTWSMWIKPTSLVEGNWQTIWSQTPASEPRFFIYAMNIDGSGEGEPEWGPVTNGISVGWDHGSNQLMTHTNNNVLSTGIWSYVTVTYDHTQSQSSRLKIYINGINQTDTSDIYSAGTIGNISSTNIRIGSNQAYGEYFPGRIDDARIYNYVRTPAQIAWDYNRGRPSAWYKFDECSGTTINDASGNSYNGTQAGTTAGTCSTASSFRGGASGDSTTNSGKINYAGTFDGSNDRVTTSAFSPLASAALTTTKVSWGGWFYPTSFSARKTLMEKATELRLDTDTSGNAICDIYTGGAFTSYAPTTTTLTSSAWNHVLCVYNGSNVLTYINGALKNTSASQTGNITAASSVLHIGQNSSSAQRYTGRIDDVRIYNFDLSNQQIKVIYNGDSAVRFAPLTGTPQ